MEPVIKEFPLPPLSAYSNENSIKQGDAVVVHFLNGVKRVGKMIAFNPDDELIRLHEKETDKVVSISFQGIKLIHIPKVCHWGPLDDIEKSPQSNDLKTERKEFVVEFIGNKQLSGETFGYVSSTYGIYLFPSKKDNEYTRVFVPIYALSEYRVGPRLGDVQVDNQLVSEEQINQAVSDQQVNKSQALGQYLKEKAIVATDDLDRALKQQRSTPNMRLGEILISESLLTKQQLESTLKDQSNTRNIPLGELLVASGIVTIDEVQFSLAKKLGIPYVDLKNFDIEQAAVRMIPASLARKHNIFPIHIDKGKLIVAMENPMQLEGIVALRFHTNMPVEAVMAARDDIHWALESYYGMASRDLGVDDWEEIHLEPESEAEDDNIFEDAALSENLIVKLINRIILDAYHKQASDIHIEPSPGKNKVQIRFRKDGTLIPYHEIPSQHRDALISRIKIMSGLDISEHRKPQDGKIDFKKYGPLDIELRIATLPTAGGTEDVVMRILTSGEPIPIAKLHLSDHNYDRLLERVSKPQGLFLVCGPTGSGKTTTLHSILGYINTPQRKVWTAEDPIEITQKGLRQLQVNPKIGLSFASALRAFLRADPDVIMVGEMRDHETTKMAIEASLTGHMVMSTLHTNGAPESVVRLLDMGVDPFNFADSLVGILAQRLTKKFCDHCKVPYNPTDEEVDSLLAEYCYESGDNEKRKSSVGADNKQLDKLKKQLLEKYGDKDGELTLYHAEGCEKCNKSGYAGRIALHELLVASDQVKKNIVDGLSVAEISHTAVEEGMLTLKQDGILKVIEGKTDLQQVRSVCIK